MRDPICHYQEEELRQSGEAKYHHLNEDLHVLIEVFAPPAEAYARMGHALEEIKKFLIPVCKHTLHRHLLGPASSGRSLRAPADTRVPELWLEQGELRKSLIQRKTSSSQANPCLYSSVAAFLLFIHSLWMTSSSSARSRDDLHLAVNYQQTPPPPAAFSCARKTHLLIEGTHDN